jgi:eukaryotic-like serine/threonine-protein kinase
VERSEGGGPGPRLTSYLGPGDGPAREALLRELIELDRACRERYGRAVQAGDHKEFAAGAEPSATNPMHRRGDVPASRRREWPTIPGLELIDFLGSGGMGVVFKARQVTLDRDVAVKLLRDDHQVDPGRRERFLQEARAVARLRHPHLVQLYEFGEVPGVGGVTSQPFLVLEYVSGGSLADLVRGSPQPPKEAARLVETLADAIHFAHQQGAVHRDLKPANVLLQRMEVTGEEQTEVVRGPQSSTPRPLAGDLCAKVTDFGLAKLLAGSDLTHSGDVLGTPSYMAPEQAAGKAGPITPAVDVYGLGAILYEALTGHPPFAAATADATLGLVRQEEPVPPRRLQPTVPRDLETICLKCLRKEPGRRYATAQDLADDLRRFGAGEPVRARQVGTGERVVRWCRRKPGMAGLLAALVLVFLAGSSGVLWQWQRARQERDAVRQEKERAERHLRMIRERVRELDQLGHDLLGRRGQYRTGQAVLEQALAFYKELLPEEGNDPDVRREAAQLFFHVAVIHQTLGQWEQAAEARRRQARLLTSLLQEEPGNKDIRYELALSHRWRGNALRDLGKTREAREEYDQAAELQEGLLRESPGNARYQWALSNTLLNTADLLSHRDDAEELNLLYQRMLELDRAAVRAVPDGPAYNAELALVLCDQGMFFLDMGRGPDAEAAVREALEIHKWLLADGRLKGYIERYAARNCVFLGRILAAAGKAPEAAESYKEAVNLLNAVAEELPESPIPLAELADALSGQADLLKGTDRRQEATELRRRAIGHFEKLTADFPEYPQNLRDRVHIYVKQVSLLCELGRHTEAAELSRKALEVDSEDPAVNNRLAYFLATGSEPSLRDAALAVRLAKKAVTAQPQSGDYRNTLGVAHYRNGDDKATVAELETAMSLRAGGDSFDWFLLPMAHWRLGHRDEARTWFDRAVNWMERHKPHDDELRRFRAEAEALLAEAREH